MVLLEREAELHAIDELLASGRAGHGALMLVEGHAGVGKTALLDETVARARALGTSVLRARASQLESNFAFGVAVQLFEPLLTGIDDERRDRLLAGSAALAGPLLERPPSWGGAEDEDRSYSLTHGLFWLLNNLAETGPVLIAIDDAHWVDRASLRVVLYLLQRFDDMAVSILVTRRLGEPGAPDDLLGQIGAHATSRRLRPAALSRDGARAMVAAALPGADDVFSDACWRMTEGNFFLLGELVAAARAEGWKPTRENARRIGTLAPAAVLRAVAVRLMRLSDDAAGVARAVAVLGDDAQLRHVAALTSRDRERVAAAADALTASDILRPLAGGALTFAHPLLASAVYADVGTGERAALHRRAAEILQKEGIAAERVAAHLLPSPGGGDAWVVEVLAAAARRAIELGAPESAASYLRRALDEPPQPAARAALLRQLGINEAATGLPSAIGWLEEALAAADDDERGETLLALGRALAIAGRHEDALAAFDDAGRQTDDADVSAEARAEAGVIGALDGVRRADLLATGIALTAPGGRRAQGAAEGALLAVQACLAALRGTPRREVLHLARQALAGDRLPAGGSSGGAALFAIGIVLGCADELAWGDHILTAAAARARAGGSAMELATASASRALIRWAKGSLAEALADAELALATERDGWQQLPAVVRGTVLGLHIDRGDLAAARELAAQPAPRAQPGSARLALWHESCGRLALLERRESDALAEFEAWRDVTRGIDNPACFAAWRSACATALVSLGRVDEARALAERELELARAFGAPRAISVALRALALVHAHGDLAVPLALLQEAVALMAESKARLELCRAQLDLGTTLRRAGRRTDAGRALGSALELARECGARQLEERALEELEVAGARVQRAALRGAAALSPSERRVVALAMEGLSNRQIAEALFVTRKAIEWHLGNAYRKLDVRSRHELPAALGVRDDPV